MIIKVAYKKVYKEGVDYTPKLEYKTSGSAGLDLVSTIDCVIRPGKSQLIPTGVFVSIPKGYEGQIRPRSGLALKYGITVLNSPGTIDSDYREEIGVILVNLGCEDFHINVGFRVAQMIVAKVEICKIKVVERDKLGSTNRKGGFGSTGDK